MVWKYPDQYSKHIIFPGPFHTKMNFVSMPTKKKERESGCTEILIETKLVTSGKLVSVLSRKAYSKALFNLKAVPEALERLLFEVFAEGNDIEIRPEALLNLINACSFSSCRDQLDKALQYESVTHITNKYEEFQIRVRDGHLNFEFPSWITLNWSSCSLMLQKQTTGNYSTSVIVKWLISSLPLMDKISQGGFYFHFFEIPFDNIKILKQHS